MVTLDSVFDLDLGSPGVAVGGVRRAVDDWPHSNKLQITRAAGSTVGRNRSGRAWVAS